MGSIYRRGAVYWVKYFRNGKPYRESSRSDKETDAKRGKYPKARFPAFISTR